MAVDWGDVIKGLAGGAQYLGGSINARKAKREEEATHEREADSQSKRALQQLIASSTIKGEPGSNIVVTPGTDEDGPGIFAVDKVKGTKRRILGDTPTPAPVAAPSAAPRRLLGGATDAPPIAPAGGAGPIAPPATPPTEDTESHGIDTTEYAAEQTAAKKRGLIPLPKAPGRDPLDRKSPVTIKVNGQVTQALVDGHGKFYDATSTPIVGKIEHYEQPRDPGVIAVQRPDDHGGSETVLAPKVVGTVVPGPNTRTPAAIQKDIASNRAQLALIDDAAKELNAHPDAVGGKRALGDVVPFLGGVSDYINQRADTGGVAARGQLANLSSMVIKDRSGAAVTVSEFPRLAPFVPRVGDTPSTIRTKLTKLRQGIETETKLLEQGGGGGGSTAPKTLKPSISRAEADALAKQGFTAAQLAAKYTITP